MNTYEQMFRYVKDYLVKTGCDEASGTNAYHFRKRSEHIWRVFLWAKRLTDGENGIHTEAVLTAAIFHDIGYALLPEGMQHAENSAILCERYLAESSCDRAFTDLVTYLVKNHSRKNLMQAAGTPLELILLMEADLLDETGALSIVWDCMAEGAAETSSFEKAYRHILNYSCKGMSVNPMVTEKAKAFWEKKQRLVAMFVEHLSYDLGLMDTPPASII